MMRPALMVLLAAVAACGSSRPASAPAGEASTDPIEAGYGGTALKIIEAAMADDGAWAKLEFLTDRIGHRLSGTSALERAIDWAADAMRKDGHANVRKEKVMVPVWVRGEESARMLAPLDRPLPILGLGGTVATPAGGVTGEVLIATSFEELGEAHRGKIVLYNTPMWPYTEDNGAGYDENAKYRVVGPSMAARHGAIAVLMRSLTARSLRTPHTGMLLYSDDAPKIPAAAVTTEDADAIARLIAAGQTVTVRLVTGGATLPDAPSANVLGEIVGSEKPEEVVVISAHIDSWDVGQGAHDDATGCVIMMQALTVLRRLGLRPRRTIRVVLFTNEENGGRGAEGYIAARGSELDDHVLALESDSGGFAPQGFTVSGSDKALADVKRIAALLSSIGADRAKAGYSGADVEPMEKHGVPGLGLWVDETHYFDYHHTAADTLDKVDPDELKRNVAAVAVLAFVAADLPGRLGR